LLSLDSGTDRTPTRKSTHDSVRPKRPLFGFGNNAQLTSPGYTQTVRGVPVIPQYILLVNVEPQKQTQIP